MYKLFCLSKVSQKAAFSTTNTMLYDLEHMRKLAAMYASAPISGAINVHHLVYDTSHGIYPRAVVEMQTRQNLNHPGGSMHGCGYFKLLDDAAWFTAQALVKDNFICNVIQILK